MGGTFHKPDLAIDLNLLKAVASGNMSLAECLTLMARPSKFSAKVARYSRLLSFCWGEQVQLMVNMTSANALCSSAAWLPQIVFASIFLALSML